MASTSSLDPLAALRASIARDGTLSSVTFLTDSGASCSSLKEATTLQLSLPLESGYGGNVTFPRTVPTRIATNKAVLAAPSDVTGKTPTPASDPSSFLTLDALVFAVQTKEESQGSYVRLSTEVGVGRLALLERGPILEYLLSKTDSWEGVVDIETVQEAGKAGDASGSAAQTATTSNEAPDIPSTTPPNSPPAHHKTKYASVSASLKGKEVAQTTADGSASTSTAAVAGTKRTYVPNRQDADYVKRLRQEHEVVLRTRNDSMHGTRPVTHSADFSSLRGQIASRLESMRRIVSGKGADHSKAIVQGVKGRNAGPASAAPSSGIGARKQRAQDPIIVLSNSPTSLVNMFNVKALLEDGTFIPPEQARRESRGVAEPLVTVHFKRNDGSKPTRFLVVDNADTLARLGGSSSAAAAQASALAGKQNDPWNRVVAVFTTGQAWQFKQYRDSDPKVLFKNVLGVYVRWHNEQPDANVKNWNVKEIVVDRNKRHTDKQAIAGFWRQLEVWMQAKKPHMLL